MRVENPRQKTLSFKVTTEIDEALVVLQARLSLQQNRTLTKTDIVEEAIRELAKREKVKCE